MQTSGKHNRKIVNDWWQKKDWFGLPDQFKLQKNILKKNNVNWLVEKNIIEKAVPISSNFREAKQTMGGAGRKARLLNKTDASDDL